MCFTNNNIKAILLALAVISGQAHAHFFIDPQGMNKDVKISPQKARELAGEPDGFEHFTDKSYGVVHHVGEGNVSLMTSFGKDLSMKEAITTVLPDGWVAYIEDGIEPVNKVSWSIKRQPWLTALSQIGVNHGYRFVVHWNQQLLQIVEDEKFTPGSGILDITDPNSGRTIHVYTTDTHPKGGVLIHQGRTYPILVKEKK